MKKKIIIVILAMVIILGEIYYSIKTKHTFTLASSNENGLKSEMVTPIFNRILVSTSKDAKVTFIDVNNTNDIRSIEYLTANSLESIKLVKGRSYEVVSDAEVTIIGVNVSIE